MKPEAGRKTAETGSAVHRDTISIGGRGSERSKAAECSDFGIEREKKAHEPKERRGWYPHTERIVSHISQVPLYSLSDAFSVNARLRLISGIGLAGTVMNPGLLTAEALMEGEKELSRDALRCEVLKTEGS